MKIHYLSCHTILEYDEVKLFTEMGHDVFSNGAYLDPKGHITHPRPGIPGAIYHEDLAQLAAEFPKTRLPEELIAPFDLIIVMHQPEVVINNWDTFKKLGKTVIWRSIGQSVKHVEEKLKPLRDDGLIVVRYSPKEANIESYMGEDAMIRFYKDENEYKGWQWGNGGQVVNFSQSLMGRRQFCHYDEIIEVIKHFDGMVYGPGNDDLGQYNGGQVSYQKQLDIMRKAGVSIYAGTWPASYTLSFMEALMMGLPIVAVSKAIAHVEGFEFIDFYEVDEILATIGGHVCDDVDQMIQATDMLRKSPMHAHKISSLQRRLAIELFGRENIMKQWKELFDNL